ncbi:hypothetical protein QYM36_009324 [Artemia franciscana]|uniref:Uncharacterized protein n=1 Tax=Artemia franciscana TaxID=6661 RepID=A0AA88HZ75_ARTSF|nr:hypothetical protein QYM36_009324 [Artemia franciscana]
MSEQNFERSEMAQYESDPFDIDELLLCHIASENSEISFKPAKPSGLADSLGTATSNDDFFCVQLELSQNKNDPKKTWKAINEVIKGTKKKQILAIQANDRIADNPVEVAELIVDHFSNIRKMIQSKIPSDRPATSEFEDNRSDGHQMNIEPCTTEEVNKIVASVKSNSAGIDGLNLWALKSILPTVPKAGSLTHI